VGEAPVVRGEVPVASPVGDEGVEGAAGRESSAREGHRPPALSGLAGAGRFSGLRDLYDLGVFPRAREPGGSAFFGGYMPRYAGVLWGSICFPPCRCFCLRTEAWLWGERGWAAGKGVGLVAGHVSGCSALGRV